MKDVTVRGRALCLTVVVGVAASAIVLSGSPQAGRRAQLLKPAAFTEKSPATFRAVFDTSVGIFVIQVHREWAPHGADRFYNLVKSGFYEDCRFFRVVKGFMAQFGIHGDPAVSDAWNRAMLPIDRARQSNIRGRVTYAMAGPATRTTQVFINFGDNSKLDIDGFAPFGEVVSSMVIVERIFDSYGELVDQGFLQAAGNAFLTRDFPRLDYIKKTTIEP